MFWRGIWAIVLPLVLSLGPITASAQNYRFAFGEAIISGPLIAKSASAPSLSKLQRLNRNRFASLASEPLSAAALKVTVRRTLKAGHRAAFEYFSKRRNPCNAPSIKRLIRTSKNLRCEPNWEVRLLNSPNDPLLSSMYSASTAAAGRIFLREAWELSTGSSENVVGVIDTGIDYTHPDLAANIWLNVGEVTGNGIDDDRNGKVDDVHGYDFFNSDNNPIDDHSHGTAVSGTIGAVGNNARGVVGINWSVKMIACKAFGSAGTGTVAAIIGCLNYLVDLRKNHGVNIVATNNSYGGFPNSQALYDAIAGTKFAGMAFVAGAGNYSSDTDAAPFYPASFDLDNIIVVGATDSSGSLTSFSNYGATSVDIAAPGIGVYTTGRNNQYGTYQGTSIATPHVTGAIALVIAYHPTYTYSQAIAAIRNNGTVLSGLKNKNLSSSLLNVAAALQDSAPSVPTATATPATAATVTPSANPTKIPDPSRPGDEGGVDLSTAKLSISVTHSKVKSTVRCDLTALRGSVSEGVPNQPISFVIKSVAGKRSAISGQEGDVSFSVRRPKGRDYYGRCIATISNSEGIEVKTLRSTRITVKAGTR